MKRNLFKEKYGSSALVVGGAEGLGEAFAREIAAKGINLILWDIQEEKLRLLKDSLEDRYDITVDTVISDLSDMNALDASLASLASKEIGLVVYNAAYSPLGEFLDSSLDIHNKLLKVNVESLLRLTYYFGVKMAARGRGGMVLLSSMASLQGTAIVAHYAASKAYIRILAEGLWEEWRSNGVDVLACIAGATGTQNYWNTNPRRKGLMIPPVQSPEQVAREALQQLGKQPSMIPGFWNRFSLRLMSFVLNQKQAVLAVSKNLRKMYP
jgi:hypothetical protein